jgi:hypothetical protein
MMYIRDVTEYIEDTNALRRIKYKAHKTGNDQVVVVLLLLRRWSK